MYDSIRRILDRLSLLLGFGAGQHRRCPAPHSTSPTPTAPRPEPAGLPAHRSPYGLDLPLDGAASALARPYLTTLEQKGTQHARRRPSFALATDSRIGLDQHLIGTEGAAA
ncbi:hypothetical protein AB0M11_17840 [Streptomyces sp. NPDC051987]|uniref:hypothetical protein n=1 Tax=Streptomyces sp. NPDC051987 TaxID=3155808 RepID=UPI00341EA706